MPERSIEELLGHLAAPKSPDPNFEAALRARLTAELNVAPDVPGVQVVVPHPRNFPNTQEIELQTLTRTPTDPPQSRRHWLRAAAVVAVVGGAVAVVALQRGDGSPVTNPTPETTTNPTPDTAVNPAPVVTTIPASVATTLPPPDSTFSGATLDTFAVSPGKNPYFVGAADEVWVSSLAGDLARLDAETGEIVDRAHVSESSPIAVDSDAVWIADAISGDVVRLDSVTGAEVARIATGVEILPNMWRMPSDVGTTRSYAQIGGITSTGDAVWVGDKAGTVMRIDPATNTIVATFDVPLRPDVLQSDGDRLLVADLLGGDAAVIDTADGTVVHEVTGLDDIAGVALYGGAMYVQDAATGTVTRIDLDSGEERTSAALGASLVRPSNPTLPTGLAVNSAGVLVDTENAPNNIHILDPTTLDEVGTLTTAVDQGDMTIAGDGSVWLVRSLANEVVHITPRAL